MLVNHGADDDGACKGEGQRAGARGSGLGHDEGLLPRSAAQGDGQDERERHPCSHALVNEPAFLETVHAKGFGQR